MLIIHWILGYDLIIYTNITSQSFNERLTHIAYHSWKGFQSYLSVKLFTNFENSKWEFTKKCIYDIAIILYLIR